jgi:hypothetical protein
MRTPGSLAGLKITFHKEELYVAMQAIGVNPWQGRVGGGQ